MDSSELVGTFALLIAAVVLCYASVLDVRTRRVPNGYWIFLSVLGMALIAARILAEDENLLFLIILVPIGAVLSDVYLDSEGDSLLHKIAPVAKYSIAIGATVLLGFQWADQEYFQYLLAVPVFMMLFVLLYLLDIIKGGADAKALIAMAVLFPVVPEIGDLPFIAPADPAANLVFPFAFSVLINAAILVVFLPVLFLFRNLASRDVRFPQMLLGYMIDSDTASPGYVWLMETMDEGRHRFHARPAGGEDLTLELRKLKDAGLSRVWVTPKIPFVLPLFAGLVLTTVVGNLMFLLFNL